MRKIINLVKIEYFIYFIMCIIPIVGLLFIISADTFYNNKYFTNKIVKCMLYFSIFLNIMYFSTAFYYILIIK
jgi:hypothetical protein